MNEAASIYLAMCRLLKYMPLMQGGTNSPLCLLVSLYVLFTSCCHLSDTLFRLFVVFNTETNSFHSENYGCELPTMPKSSICRTIRTADVCACTCICRCSTKLCLLTMDFQKVPRPVSKFSCTAMTCWFSSLPLTDRDFSESADIVIM